jgi:hypothetical protein
MNPHGRPIWLPALLLLGFLGLPETVLAQDIHPPKEATERPTSDYSPYPQQTFPDRVYWGDTHLHTSYSTDAGMVGAKLGPDEAYRFSRGETVTSNTGQPARLRRPLDFVVVADHAELLGLSPFIARSDPTVLADPLGKKWHDLVKAGKGYDAFIEWANFGSKRPFDSPEMTRSAWDDILAAAERHNDPGAFTAFIGFEWTSMPGGDNIHRVVVFRDGADRATQVVPFSSYDSENPEKLWEYMAAYEEKSGGRMLAIPHNGNLSNGRFFELQKFNGTPLDAAWARERARREPLVEVTQAKGTGEAHPFLSDEDEFADFELLDAGNITGTVAKTNEMLVAEYAREALKTGLRLEAELGTNPFKFGMIGSTDNHTALPTTAEDNWFGKAPFLEPSAERYKDVLIKSQVDPKLSVMGPALSAAGLVAVWSGGNDRHSLFDAMERREAYASTGTRLLVRVFGGFDFTEADLDRSDFAAHGYAGGVPMGGDLSESRGKAPALLIRALRDVDGANLDRIQVIKGWGDSAGKTHERIHDVAVSDGRKIGTDGRCKTPVGNTVDVAEASYTNAIGDSYLQGFWRDPDFDPTQRAFYYVRVIEIPTPRWTAFDAKHYDIDMPEGTKLQLQERAFTSPIWYTP